MKVTIMGDGGKPILVFDNQKLQYNPASNFDVNYDDYAFEIVDDTRSPEFQLVIAKDYSTIYVNARLYYSDNAVTVMKDDGIFFRISLPEANKPKYKLDRVFKYPSYIHQGERE